MQFKFSLLCGKQLNPGWTVSCWCATPVCLLAHSEIGNWEKGLWKGSGLPYVSRQASQQSVKRPLPNATQEPWRVALVQEQGQRKGSLFCGVMEWAHCPRVEHQSLLWPHAGGGIRGRPAGAHSLQLWSAAAQPNARQHLQLSALKRPKKFRLQNTQPAWLLVYRTELCQFLDGRFLNTTTPVVLTLICFYKARVSRLFVRFSLTHI